MISANPAPPCALVIFGAKGDLTKRKLIPSLYNLEKAGLLSPHFAILGFARGETTEVFRESLNKEIREFSGNKTFDNQVWEKLLARIEMTPGDFKEPKDYRLLEKKLLEIDQKQGTEGNYLFYLATPPVFFGPIVDQLSESKLLKKNEKNWRRVIIEKPFGRDFDSAMALDKQLSRDLSEDQIYRIDHYLGKETVQNIMVLRFANGVFEPIWNHRYIDSVQITVSETLGVESRADYYETAGALRDMVPNHLFQVMSMIAMEPPASFAAEDVRDEKAKVLKSILPLTAERVLTDTVRGQYRGYRQEKGVAPESVTETFAALKVTLDNWRWAKVPFYLRTGKKLASRKSEVVVQFKTVPFQLFRNIGTEMPKPNRLVLQIQPQEKVSLEFGAKIPGPGVKIGNVTMNLDYAQAFGGPPQTGYETLIFDCMKGDPTLFQRADQVETAWKVIQPVLDVWGGVKPRDFPNYEPGSPGPQVAEELIKRDGREWRM